jgi:hypothetical protein
MLTFGGFYCLSIYQVKVNKNNDLSDLSWLAREL